MTGSDDWDLIGSTYQGLVQTHGPAKCAGQPCVIHNPSDHPLKDAPIYFRVDRLYHAERACPHLIMHPDPDSVAHLMTRDPSFVVLFAHECCKERCCEKKEGTDGTPD